MDEWGSDRTPGEGSGRRDEPDSGQTPGERSDETGETGSDPTTEGGSDRTTEAGSDRGRERVFVLSVVAIGLVALAHAALTWPPRATVALFAGGAAIAYVAEAVAIRLGWLEHHVGPQVLGVPPYVLLGWTGVTYAAFRAALLAVDPWPAVALGAALATGYDVLTDHRGVEEGYWTYTDDLPGPRLRAVPWWNFAGWLAISAATAALAVPFL